MSTVQTTYTDKVNAARHRLSQEDKTFEKWAKENGYTLNQVYATTRRKTVSKFGISREIAEKLGLIDEVSHDSNR